jgi:hypothetical protein
MPPILHGPSFITPISLATSYRLAHRVNYSPLTAWSTHAYWREAVSCCTRIHGKLVHKPHDTDHKASLNFVNWYFHRGTRCDDAWFHLNGYVRSAENPTLINEVPLHHVEVSVRCATGATIIIRAHFFTRPQIHSDMLSHTLWHQFLIITCPIRTKPETFSSKRVQQLTPQTTLCVVYRMFLVIQ